MSMVIVILSSPLFLSMYVSPYPLTLSNPSPLTFVLLHKSLLSD